MKAALRGIATYLPQKQLTNEDLHAAFPDWEIAKIYGKTGIEIRHLSDLDECASDLGVCAVERLFEAGLCNPGQVDYLLFCTQSPDYFLPTSSCLMHERLGLRNDCGALDFNLGCSGYIYGLSLAKGLIESGQARHVVLVTADTYTKYLDPNDRGVRTLFGDGAAASLISEVESTQDHLGPFVLGTDGKGGPNLIVEAGAARNAGHGDPYLRMNGADIYNFALEQVPAAVHCLLEKAEMTLDAIDYFVFHQANQFMLESLRKKLRLPREKFCINMEKYGNTVSATIPMALEIAVERGDIVDGARLMLVGFGVGYSWGATLLRMSI